MRNSYLDHDCIVAPSHPEAAFAADAWQLALTAGYLVGWFRNSEIRGEAKLKVA